MKIKIKIKKMYLYIGGFIILFTVGLLLLSNKPLVDKSKLGSRVLYWGASCPHCHNVEEYLKKNKDLFTKLKLQKREVYNDQTNAGLMYEHARQCGISRSSLGVPFLYFEGKCISGDTPIIEFFKKQKENATK